MTSGCRRSAGDGWGHFAAINPLTGQKKWEVPVDRLAWFRGDAGDRWRPGVHRQADRRVHCARQATGKTLWQFKTGSRINSTAITYTHKGRQYVTIASGLGGGLANRYARQGAHRRLGLDVCVDAVAYPRVVVTKIKYRTRP